MGWLVNWEVFVALAWVYVWVIWCFIDAFTWASGTHMYRAAFYLYSSYPGWVCVRSITYYLFLHITYLHRDPSLLMKCSTISRGRLSYTLKCLDMAIGRKDQLNCTSCPTISTTLISVMDTYPVGQSSNLPDMGVWTHSSHELAMLSAYRIRKYIWIYLFIKISHVSCLAGQKGTPIFDPLHYSYRFLTKRSEAGQEYWAYIITADH